MTAIEFVKRNTFFGVVGVTSAALAFYVEPFKSNFLLAIPASFGVGILFAIVEQAARELSKKVKGAEDQPKD